MPNKAQLDAMLHITAEIAAQLPLSAHRIASAIQALQSHAASLHRRYEAACSYEWANTEAYERRTERLEARVEELAATLPGLTVEHQRDPRGWPLIVKINGREIGRLG